MKTTNHAFLFLVILLTSICPIYGTHISGGYIYAKRVDNLSFTYEITFVGFRDVESGIQFGGGILDFGDGNHVSGASFEIIETQIKQNRVMAEFKTLHTFNTPGNYTISYREFGRNSGVSNLPHSIITSFLVQTTLVIDPFLGVVNSPLLIDLPIFSAEGGKRYLYTPKIDNVDGDSLVFIKGVPLQSKQMPIASYRGMIDAAFYTHYSTGNQARNGVPTYTINPFTGTIDWDAAGDVYTSNHCSYSENCSAYTIGFEIIAYRKKSEKWLITSRTLVEYQLEVSDNDLLPQIYLPHDYCSESNFIEFEIDAKTPISLVMSPSNDIISVNDIPYSRDTLYQQEGMGLYRIELNEKNAPKRILGHVFGPEMELFSSFSLYFDESCPVILSLTERSQHNPHIFPNPATDIIHFANTSAHQRFYVIGLDGKVHCSGKTSEGSVIIRDLPNGVYLVSLTDSNLAPHSFRLIKQD